MKEQQVLDDLEKAARIRNKEKLIDDLMFGEESAEQILEQHRETVLREEKKIVFSNSGERSVDDYTTHLNFKYVYIFKVDIDSYVWLRGLYRIRNWDRIPDKS